MSLDAFTITPSIFEIDYEQWITLKITFVPRSPTFYVSILLCGLSVSFFFVFLISSSEPELARKYYGRTTVGKFIAGRFSRLRYIDDSVQKYISRAKKLPTLWGGGGDTAFRKHAKFISRTTIENNSGVFFFSNICTG